MDFKSNEKGKCPICNSENLSYGPMELEGILGNSVAFPWHCPDCDTNGKEWYITEFDITESGDGNIANEPEVCPDCGFEINYGSTGLDGDSLYYEYNCTECDGSGREYYTLKFDGHTVEEKDAPLKLTGNMREIDISKKDIETESNDYIRNYIDKFKSDGNSDKYEKGLSIRDEIVSAWKNKNIELAYDKWSELYDLFSDGWDEQGNKTSDWNEEQNYRDIYELQSIVDTIEDKCVYDITDYGKAKEYRKMGYDY